MSETLNGVVCRCGGAIRFEQVSASRAFRWEAFCCECKACDANGYATRHALVRDSPFVWDPTLSRFRPFVRPYVRMQRSGGAA